MPDAVRSKLMQKTDGRYEVTKGTTDTGEIDENVVRNTVSIDRVVIEPEDRQGNSDLDPKQGAYDQELSEDET